MKKISFISLFLLLSYLGHSQTSIEKIKLFYDSANFDCYTEKIQQNIIEMNNCLDSLAHLYDNYIEQYNYFADYPEKRDSILLQTYPCISGHTRSDINLSSEIKIFIPAVSIVDVENYTFEDSTYDYLVIDSSRGFIVACVDKNMTLIGYSDVDFQGTFVEIDNNIMYHNKKLIKLGKKKLKNIYKQKPDLILFCNDFYSTFLYIKDNRIYQYQSNGKIIELNESIRNYLESIENKNHYPFRRRSLKEYCKENYDFIPSEKNRICKTCVDK